MKLNWGHGTAIFFSGFVVFMLFLVFKSFQTDFDLVTEDYYAKELVYQNTIEKMNNEKDLVETIVLSKTEAGVMLAFPKNQAGMVVGEVQFFRSSDKDLDRLFKIETNQQGQQVFSYEHFQPGAYKVKVDWDANGTSYYKEVQLSL